ncbi:MAG: hypothetical protein FVQ85_07915 [Planctomycetes bacterium]|nr:hypothetical protein [Planctomycetota bacterium]
MNSGGKIMVRYANLVGAIVLLMGCCIVSSGWAKAEEAAVARKPGYDWRQTDSTLALLNRDKVVWQLNFDKKQGKPCFHPVGLIDGTELTSLRPADHRWHRALWFSWKFINGVNYWEEDPATGLSPGRTEVVEVKVVPHDDSSAHIVMNLRYHPPAKSTVLTEMRVITVSAPGVNGRYRIDWYSLFTAGEKDVLLGRTPIPGEQGGKGWGGYAGLSVRMAKATRGWEFVDSQGRKDKQAHSKKARWVDFSGELPDGKEAGITIFDHPDNLRHPSPWYVEKGMPYFSPAVLFNKPYTITARESLELWYRILIHPGRVDKELLEGECKAFSNLKGAAIAEVLEAVDQEKAAIRVDLLVCQVIEGVKIDWETAVEIKNLMGQDKGLSPAVILKSAVQAKQVARDKLESLVDLLRSKGYLKILMNPTLEVLDGKTAKIRSSSREPTGKEITDSFEVTPRILDDGYINVATNVVFGNKPISNLRNRIKDGQSFVIGSVKNKPGGPGQPVTETIFIVTAAISKGD